MNVLQSRQGFGRVAAIIIITAIALMMAGLFAWHSLEGPASLTSGMLPVPANWKLYTDPKGYVSLMLPPMWDGIADGGADTGDGNNVHLSLITYLLQDATYNQSKNFSSTQIKLSIGAWPNEVTRQYMCQQQSMLGSQQVKIGTFIGDMNGTTINIFTKKAFVSITYAYPGASADTASPGLIPVGEEPTPVSSVESASDTRIIYTILNSFQAIPNQPASC